MSSTDTARIRNASVEDLDAIVRIADDLAQHRDADQGFLVSGYSAETYRAYIEHSQAAVTDAAEKCLLWVLETDDGVQGFFLAYNRAYLHSHTTTLEEETSERVIVERFDGLGAKFDRPYNFYVIKQVAVRPEQSGKGYGKALYHQFFEYTAHKKFHRASETEKARVEPDVADIFVAVMSQPLNRRSMDFHAALGFQPVISWASPGEPDPLHSIGRVVFHAHARELLFRKNSGAAPQTSVAASFEALRHATELYLHEDNLNWRKFSFLSQYTAALVAAQFVAALTENPFTHPAFQLIPILTVLALACVSSYLSYTFSGKLKSGLLFMDSHKRSALLIESKLSHLVPGVYPPLGNVPRISRTVDIINTARFIFYPIIVIATVVSLYFAWGQISVRPAGAVKMTEADKAPVKAATPPSAGAAIE